MDSIFKANDIRGVFQQTLTADIAYNIGRALAVDIRGAATENKIAAGRDGRLSSPVLADAVQRGLQDGGVCVLDIGLSPTPVLYYAANRLAGGNGIMVTGSHNPKDYNGFKITVHHKTLHGDGVANLRRRIETQNFGGKQKTAAKESAAIHQNYIHSVVAANPISRPLKVVLDAGNGAAGIIAPSLFARLGCEVLPLFCEVDGNFPNHHPDPARPENLTAAREKLIADDADVALVFDGDGDRLGIILPQKEMIFSDQLLMVFARDMLSRNAPQRIVFDVKCSAHLPPWIIKHGGAPDMQPTGHAFIKSRMRETGALLGGEMSGHFYFLENWFGFDDALFAGARLISILADDAAVFDDLPISVASPELSVDMSGKNQHDFMARLKRQASFGDACDIITIDGLRAEYRGGFGLVRASNTTPSLVLRFEAGDEKQLRHIQNQFRRVLLAADDSLQLPF